MKLLEWLDKAKDAILGVGAVTLGGDFFVQVLKAVSDGKVTQDEFEMLLHAAEGWEFVIVVGLWAGSKWLQRSGK